MFVIIILLLSGGVIKIHDFGINRLHYTDDYDYKTHAIDNDSIIS